MVDAELTYNPYLIDTKFKFNKNDPRINSLVDKYHKFILQSWIHEVPKIYHDEMNGYDFDLLFSGTELEYAELLEAFKNVNVSNEDVRILHVNKLESREEKVNRIEVLLSWLQTNKNKRFNYEEFFEKNKELIINSYQYVVLHKELQETQILIDRDIKVESIMDISELDNTTLTNTPILFYINNNSLKVLQSELKQLLSRDDVGQHQLFFMIDNSLNISFVERTIIDLGVVNPQLIKNIDDEIVLKYFDVYPITEYISDMIKGFNHECDVITPILDKENEDVSVKNKDVHERINNIEKEIEKLKHAIDLFEDKNELMLDGTYQYLTDCFYNKLYKWRSRKTKLHVYDEALYYAKELSNSANEWIQEFYRNVNNHEDMLVNEIYQQYTSWYTSGEQEIDYQIDIKVKEYNEAYLFKNNIQNELMESKEENMVSPDKGILGSLFYNQGESEEKVLQITWRLSEWREHVNKIVAPIMDSVIKDSRDRVEQYAHDLANDYCNKLLAMLEMKNNEEDRLSSELSVEEQLLKEDIEWLNAFKEQVNKIVKSFGNMSRD